MAASKEIKQTDEVRVFQTSDVNFAAYLAYHSFQVKKTNVTTENGRARVWFEFEMTEDDFNKSKNDFFSHSPESKVIAQKLFQERDRIYSLMIQVRNTLSPTR
jgi:hypothetical protein